MEAVCVKKKSTKKSKSKISESMEKFGTNARTALNAVLSPTQSQEGENSAKGETSNATTQKGLASLFRRRSSDNDKNEIIEMNQAKDSSTADKKTSASVKEDKEEKNMKLLSEASTSASGSDLASGVAASADNKGLSHKTPLQVHRIMIPDIDKMQITLPMEDEPDSDEEPPSTPFQLTQSTFCTFSKKPRWKRSSTKSAGNEHFPRRHTFLYEAEDELEESEEEEKEEEEEESDNELEDIEEEPLEEISENTNLLQTHLVVKLPQEGYKHEDTKKTMHQAISGINKVSTAVAYDQSAPSTSRGHPNGTCSAIPADPIAHSTMCRSSSAFSCNKKTENVEAEVKQERSLFAHYFECRSISTLSNVSPNLSFLREENKSLSNVDNETRCGKLRNGVRHCFRGTYQSFLSLSCGLWRIITCTKQSCPSSSMCTSEHATKDI